MLRVLFIEDDFKAAQATIDLLKHRGHECFWVLDAYHGMKALLTQPMDVIILDLQLPEVDGLSFLKAIRALKIDLPVAVLSSYISSAAEKEIIELGPAAVLHKPASLKELINKIEEIAEISSRRPYGSLFDQVVFESQQSEVKFHDVSYEENSSDSFLAAEEQTMDQQIEVAGEVSMGKISAGDMLAENISDAKGKLLLSRGTVLTEQHVQRIQQLYEEGSLQENIRLYRNK